MPLSTQGQEVLGVIYESYRRGYVKYNPGCNENDVEREFLASCQTWEETDEGANKIRALIEEIR